MPVVFLTDDITLATLAGGRSMRFGRDKALAEVQGPASAGRQLGWAKAK